MPAARTKQTESTEGLIAIYQCLCDETRLRILHLLANVDQLCVCHFQELLGKSQVQISKHLSYLKGKGLVEATKSANWMIYRLPAGRPLELEANLRCLQDCVQTHTIFRQDLQRLKALRPGLAWLSTADPGVKAADCCGKPTRPRGKRP